MPTTDLVNIWPQKTRQEDGETILSARVEMPGHPTVDLWYRVPVEHHGLLAPDEYHDAFAIAALFPAMQSGHRREGRRRTRAYGAVRRRLGRHHRRDRRHHARARRALAEAVAEDEAIGADRITA